MTVQGPVKKQPDRMSHRGYPPLDPHPLKRALPPPPPHRAWQVDRGRGGGVGVGRPRELGFGPANGWAALSKHFGGYPDSAPTGRVALPG